MNLLRLYLWKEWREQRAAALALLALLPVLVLSLAYTVPARFVVSSVFVAAMALLALVVMLIAIGGEVLGCGNRSSAGWLERVPEGLQRAFQAKLVLFAAASVMAVGYGQALGMIAASMRALPGDPHVGSRLLDVNVVGFLPALVLALWTFAASAWCGRGMVSLLAGGLLAATLLLPLWVHSLVGYGPQRWEVQAAYWTTLGAALASAWFGFLGTGRGSGQVGAALRGISAGALGVLPLWSWAGHRWLTREHFDLASPASRIEGVFVFGNGERALLTAYLEESPWLEERQKTLFLDLEHGTFEWLPGSWLGLQQVWNDAYQSNLQDPDLVRYHDPRGPGRWVTLDARTGLAVDEREAWSGPETEFSDAAGLGAYLYDENTDRVYVDPFQRRSFEAEDVLEDGFEAYIGPRGWIVRKSPDWSFVDDEFVPGEPTWFEFSPADGALVQANWLQPVLDVGPFLADGRILAIVEDGLAVLDTEQHRILPIDSDVETWDVEPASGRAGFRPGEPVLLDIDEERYLFDEDHLELRRADPSYDGRFVRCLPDGTLFFLTETGLERRDPVSGARVVVFRLAEARVD